MQTADQRLQSAEVAKIWNVRLLLVAFVIGGPTTSLSAQSVDTVRVGAAELRGASLRLGSYAMESFVRDGGTDTPISTTIQTVGRARIHGLSVYTINTLDMTTDGDTTVSDVMVRAEDFALVHHRVKGLRDSAAVAATPGHLTGWVALPGEPILLIDETREGAVFPVDGQIPWLFPLLPLRPGYAAAIPHYSQWDGREVWTTIEVVGSVDVDIDDEVFDCWVVDGGELFPGYRVTYWVDKQTRRIVQGVARGGTGQPEYWSALRRR